MADIIDELYDDFKMYVEVISEALAKDGSYLLIDDTMEEDLADGICATISLSLGTPVYRFAKWGAYPPYSVNKYGLNTRQVEKTPAYYVNNPTVLCYETELRGVWQFFIERDVV